MKVIKRDGSEVIFDASKIINAISKANKAGLVEELTTGQIKVITDSVVNECQLLNRAIAVEEIQDMVENRLMLAEAYETARRYIKYRFTHELARHSNTTDDKILTLIECCNEEAKQENANKNPVVNSTQRDYMAGEVSKDISRRILLPEDIVKAHDDGLIHFHDMDYYGQHMHNCFTGGTKFVTESGLRAFNTFKDGEEVTVIDMNGNLRKATVRKYGEQKMVRVTLKNNKMSHTVICTPNHRWILKDGSVTTNLSVGDKLWLTPDSTGFEINDKEDATAFCIGFVLGDGCDTETGVRVRLCGEKTKYAKYFEMAGYSLSPLKGNDEDMVAYKGGSFKQDFINGKGWRFMSTKCKKIAFCGFYAADGSTLTGKLSVADERLCSFIEDASALAGYHISSKTDVVRDTNFKENARLISYHFITKQPSNWNWVVESIVPYNHGEVPAWCVEEPVTHSFTLEKGIVTGNCDLINLEDMLQNGTVISGTLIEKPHSFATACNIATQIIAQVASNQYGGQSISLTHLAPFVQVSREKCRKAVQNDIDALGISASPEKITELTEARVKDEVRRGVQTIQYQILTLLTTNGQAPFVTIFAYLNEAKTEQEKQDLAMIIEEVLKQRYEGVKNEAGVWVTPAFPKIIYVLEEDNVTEGTPYWYLTELAAKCTAKRMVPDYISEKKMLELKIDKNGEGHCYTCMGCRSFLTPYVNEDGQPQYYGRFNQGVVTVNLVDIALCANHDMDKFWEIFDERMELCHKALQCRHERLTGTLSDVAPILWQHGALLRLKKGETIDKYLHGGYSTISLGYAGLWECVYGLVGKKLNEPEGEELGLQIMRKLNEYTAKWKAAENIDYSLYGTPLESTTYRFAKTLQKRFGVIKGVTDKNYITNSYHIHVTEPIDAFEKLAIEARFQALSPGGAISYVEVPNMQNNIPAVLSVMKFIYDNIIYAELNTKSDYCQECGWDGEIDIVEDGGKLVWKCPKCGNTDQSKMNVARRTCGYIGTQYWNQGRTQEIKERVLHL